MSQRLLVVANRGSFESAYQVATLALTAAAMGETVKVFLTFDALHSWATGTFGRPDTSEENSACQRAKSMGLPSPLEMLNQARSMGVKLVCCDTMLKLCAIEPQGLGVLLDAVEGLPEIWRFGQTARILYVN